jgi:hypothetical protein
MHVPTCIARGRATAAIVGEKTDRDHQTRHETAWVEAMELLTKLIKRYGRVDLILVDELGYLQLDRRGAELLFQVLTEREERSAIAIASNEPFSSWTKTFTDPRLCAAIVDRLTFAGQIIETGSNSYRLAHARNARAAVKTIDRWKRTRLGQGTRTDLRKPPPGGWRTPPRSSTTGRFQPRNDESPSSHDAAVAVLITACRTPRHTATCRAAAMPRPCSLTVAAI